MDNRIFEVRTKIDAKAFRDFAVFDNLRLRRAWRSPLLFACILTGFACVCFALQQRAEQAPLLGGVLLAVGLGLPLFYFSNFFLSIRAQIKRMKLDQAPKEAYTLTLSAAQGVTVAVGAKETTLGWTDLFGAYRVQDSIYLYAATNRAYLLPNAQIEGGADALWELLRSNLQASDTSRVRDFRR